MKNLETWQKSIVIALGVIAVVTWVNLVVEFAIILVN